MPDEDGTPDEEGHTAPVPDEVWHRCLTDSERAIRETAPREPSARERPALPSEPPPGPHEQWGHRKELFHHGDPHPYEPQAVGELWQPSDPWPGPRWRELDGRPNDAVSGRVLGTAVAITVVLGLFSQLTAPGSPYKDGQDDTISQQSERAPTGWPTTTATPGPTAPPSG